jgi:signal transduction histidine kinase
MAASGWLPRIKTYCFPHEAEHHPGFRQEIQRLSVLSLYVITGVTLCMPLVGSLFHFIAAVFEPAGTPLDLWLNLPFFAIAGILMGLARTAFGRFHARKIALVSGFVIAVALTWGTFLADPSHPDRALASMVNLIVVMLVGVAAIPAWPIQIFLLGGAITTVHWISARMAVDLGLIEPVSLHSYAGLDSVTFLCTALAAVNYQRLIRAYWAHQSDMEAQSRLLVSDNAASLGRFAATLSHELNNPIGVAASAVDSLRRIEQRTAREPADTGKLAELREPLFKAASASLGVLRGVVERMQRFTNLDRAEKLSVDVGDLLRDVAAMLEPEVRQRVRVETPDESLPRVTLKPQQVSAVLTKLVERAVAVSEASGEVDLSARRANGRVEIKVIDQGPMLGEQESESLFEPGFAVQGSRVGANWGLYSARRAVQEQGGDIDVRSRGEGGAEVTVRLPLG